MRTGLLRVATAGIFVACTGFAIATPASAANCTSTTPVSVPGQTGTVVCTPTTTPKKRVCTKKKKVLGRTYCTKYKYV